MAEVEKVIEELKQLEHCLTKKCDITCRHFDEDEIEYPCRYDVSSDVAIDEAIQTIRELQSNQCHLNSPCEYQNKDIEIEEVCEWKIFDEEANAYNTTCGGAFWFNDGSPKDNGFKYCFCCSRKIKVVE